MKVVLINTLYQPMSVGGAERVVRTLARGLVERGDAVTVITLWPEPSQRIDEEDGVRIVRLPLQNVYWPFGRQAHAAARLIWHGVDSFNPAAAKTLTRILREERPDVVHSHNLAGFSVSAWQAVKSLGLPLVHTMHDYYLLCPRATMRQRDTNCEVPCSGCRLFSASRRTMSARVDSVVAVSRFQLHRHEVQKVFSPHASRQVVHNCLTHSKPAAASGLSATRERPDVLRLGYLGRIEPVKGIEVLLQATTQLQPGSWNLCIAGKGDAAYMSSLQARYPSPDITFVGHCSLPDFFRQVDLLVVPTLSNEPLGMVAFEAYFFGVPVVAACRGGLPEIVTPETGLLFDPDSPDALVGSLRTLQAEPRRLAALATGTAAAAAQFEPDRMLDAYRTIYSRTIAAHQRTGMAVV